MATNLTIAVNEVERYRIPTKTDYRDDIHTYGIDNLYPQRMELVAGISGLTESAIEVESNFIQGLGFENDIIINEDQQTINDLLRANAQDYSLFRGFAIHVQYNINGQIAWLKPLDFKYCRFGLPDENGAHDTIKYSINWEKDRDKTSSVFSEVISAPKFNPDPVEVKRQIIDYGGIEEYPGQILYWTPKKDIYPKCSFNSIIDSVQSNGEIPLFELSNIQNGFLSTTIFKHPGEITDEADRANIEAKIRQMKGAGGANSIMLAEIPHEFTGNLLENIPANNNDNLFTNTLKHVENTIVQRYAIPPVLLGIMPQTGMFNQEDLINSYTYYNIKTKNHRIVFEVVYSELVSYLSNAVEIGEIMTKEFEGQTAIGGVTTSSDAGGDKRTETGGRSPEELEAQANLRGSVGGVQGILSIQASVASGTTSYDAGISLLVELYGFTEEIAIELLGEKKELENGNTSNNANN